MVTQLDLIEQEIKKIKVNLLDLDPVPDALMRDVCSRLLTLHSMYIELNKGYTNELLKKAR